MMMIEAIKRLANSADATRVEVSLRVGIMCLFAFILSIANMPKIVPLSTSYIIGSLAAPVAVVVPTLMFTCLLGLPMILVAMVFAVIVCTALLAAVTVSDGLFVALYGVAALLATSGFFGKNSQKTALVANSIIALFGYLAVSFAPLVKDGLSATVEPNDSVKQVADWVQTVLSAVCDFQGQEPDCWQDALPDSIEGQLPMVAGDLAGQTFIITKAQDGTSITIDIPGGLWLVSGLWTFQGVDNPLAGFRNFLIAITWGFACILLGVVLPPFRTARREFSQGLIPALLTATTTHAQSLEALEESKDKIVAHLTSIHGGAGASLTTFEPRIFRAPLEFTVPQLQKLMIATEQAVLSTYDAMVWEERDENKTTASEKPSDLQHALTVMNACAEALVSNNREGTENLRKLKVYKNQNEKHGGHPPFDADTHLSVCCEQLLDACLEWLDAMQNPQQPTLCSKEAAENLLRTYLPSIIVPMLPIIRMFEALTFPFRPSTWDMRALLWSIEFTLGSVAMFAAQVFWNKYGDLAVPTVTGDSGAVFSGWAMLAYCFTFQPTMECTIKKGILRAFGTCMGGLMAWLGVIVCSWSYDDDAEINPYGFIAWLTICCTIAAHFTVETGAAGRMGKSPDHGFAGEYFCLVIALIGLEVYRGNGDKNPLVVNRVVSNLLGIACAAIAAALPPAIRGSDPQLVVEQFSALRDAYVGLVQALLHEDESQKIDISDDYKTGLLGETALKRSNALYLMKNAGGFKAFPFLRVDERLLPLAESLAADESLLSRLLEQAFDIVQAGQLEELTNLGSEAHFQLIMILQGFGVNIQTEREGAEAGESFSDPGDRISHFISLAQAISDRLHVHEMTLGKILGIRK